MKDANDIDALKKERERLEGIREAMLKELVAHTAPSEASARSIQQELAPIDAQIANTESRKR